VQGRFTGISSVGRSAAVSAMSTVDHGSTWIRRRRRRKTARRVSPRAGGVGEDGPRDEAEAWDPALMADVEPAGLEQGA